MDFTIRSFRTDEIDDIASFIARGYYHDIFFHWVVGKDSDRHKVVTDYYKVYLNAGGCQAYIAETSANEIIGASVWLPHNVDARIYDDIDKATGKYASQFRAVADKSHLSEPPMAPFYQLVAIVVDKNIQKRGLGSALLKHQLDKLDKAGISTYLEASSPYRGSGLYSNFNYVPVGEHMVFAENAFLYPLWRPAPMTKRAVFGGHTWKVLDSRNGDVLLLAEDIITLGQYHDVFEKITWENSSVRKYLNETFLSGFSSVESAQIKETAVENTGNHWFCTTAANPTSDKVFLLSLEETVLYLGDSGQLKNPSDKFFIDDNFNDVRKAVLKDGSPSRWFLRTPGNSPDFAVTVTNGGMICVTGDFVNRSSSRLFNVGIRPAMWVREDGVRLI